MTTAWAVFTNEGYGLEPVYWAGHFDTEQEAEQFIVGDDSDGRWDGPTCVYEIDIDENGRWVY